MKISEIFYSIQGEGELTGMPSVFIRTSGCNLRCSWCDTPYASWYPEGEEVQIASILDEVRKYPARHCVLTGGEPMIAKGIHELAAALRESGHHITIETAGTVSPNGIACDLASLSPKLSNSTPSVGNEGNPADPAWVQRHEKTRLQPHVLRDWIDKYCYQLKFVVSGDADLLEIEQVLAATDCQIPPAKVLLMPEGTTSEVLGPRQDFVLRLCKERGFRFCDRLHIRLFGNSKGT